MGSCPAELGECFGQSLTVAQPLPLDAARNASPASSPRSIATAYRATSWANDPSGSVLGRSRTVASFGMANGGRSDAVTAITRAPDQTTAPRSVAEAVS